MENLNKEQFFNYLLVLFFIMLLTLPLIGIKLTSVDAAEQRVHNKRPKLILSREGFKLFPHDFEAYFNDNFGFRSYFLDLYNQAVHYLFKESGSPRVIVGKNDWLFYSDDRSLEDIQGKEHLSPEELEKWALTIKERGTWLASKGIKYRFVIPPDKHSIFSEYLPASHKRHNFSRFQELMTYLGSNPYVIDLLPILKENKTPDRPKLYFRTDTHWTSYGAYLGYLNIMKSLGNDYLPNTILYKRENFKNGPKTKRDLAVMARLNLLEEDIVPEPDKNYFYPAQLLDPLGFKQNAFKTGATYAPFKTRTLLIFHDSFTSGMSRYFSSGFKRVVYFWGMPDNEQFVQLVLQENPDVVIEERVERSMRFVPNPDLYESLKKLNDPKMHQYTDVDLAKRKEVYKLIMKNAQLSKDEKGVYISLEGELWARFPEGEVKGGAVDSITQEGDHITIYGWAAFTDAKMPADYVGVIANNRVVFIDGVNLDRADVANYFNNPTLTRVGFKLKIPNEIVGSKDNIKLFAIKDKQVAFLS
ncbi:DHHW family protein [Legionella gresilensis]|uniref:DHHW family protein n=1 Tax=Legionella gresilensis TaxID=91823 RepID=UPI001040EEA4|nr:DHHW family protein [Legionella gresilensis]